MKNVSNASITCALTCVLGGLLLAASAHAADAAMPVMPPATVTTTTSTTAAPAMPVLPAATPAGAAATPMAMTPPPAMTTTTTMTTPATGTASLNELENRATEQAKDAVRHFNTSSANVTLDDLNTAKMAVAKIDALIEIEKRLAELQKVRDEREGKSSTSASALSSAIPVSALTLPSKPASMVSMTANVDEEPVRKAKKHSAPSMPTLSSSGASNSVTRISGVNGNYSAVMRSGGDEKVVKIGDHLADGSSVVNITPSSVSLMRDGNVKQVKVEGVETVFGRSY